MLTTRQLSPKKWVFVLCGIRSKFVYPTKKEAESAGNKMRQYYAELNSRPVKKQYNRFANWN